MLLRNAYAYASIAACLAAGLGLAGCDRSNINPNDSTKPTAVIQVKGADGQYAPQSSVNFNTGSNGTVDIMCVVEDVDGVKQAKLTFPSSASSCTAGGGVFTGSYPITGMPANMEQSLSGDNNGQVITKLPLIAAIKGPITCNVPQNGTGGPIGAELKVVCSGSNWSSTPANSSASTTLVVKLQ